MLRLSALMFFQIFMFGAFNPILSMYLQDTLRFSSSQTGLIMAMSVVSSILAPLLSVYVVDRRIRAKWLFILCHGILALSAIGLALVRSFQGFLILYLLNALFTGPAMGMLNAISFQSLQDKKGGGKNYGLIRVWGTIGWMGAGYLVSGLWALLPKFFPNHDPGFFQSFAFFVSTAGSAVCIALALGLPRGNLDASNKREFIPRDALKVMKQKSVVILSVVYLASAILDKLFFFGTAPYLLQLGFKGAWIPSILTLGQVTEIFMLFGLGSLLMRFSYKPVLLFGAVAQALRFFLFQTGVPALLLVGISMNGLVFACLYSTVLMYIDSHSSSQSRQGVHQLIQLFIGGSSTLLGNLIAGALGQFFRKNGQIDFRSFWTFALCGAMVSIFVIVFLFKQDKVQSA